jgi:hypothetical protein
MCLDTAEISEEDKGNAGLSTIAAIVVGAVFILPCYFLVVDLYTPVKTTCLASNIVYNNTVCSRPVRCQCFGCDQVLCTTLEVSNTTGPCCGPACEVCTGRGDDKRCRAYLQSCHAEIGQCYDFAFDYDMDGHTGHYVVKCELNDKTCWDFYWSRLVQQDSFTCWYLKKTYNLHFDDPGHDGNFIGGWFGISVGFCFWLLAIWYIIIWISIKRENCAKKRKGPRPLIRPSSSSRSTSELDVEMGSVSE